MKFEILKKFKAGHDPSRSYQCIDRSALCDGKADCSDKFDESEKICEFKERHSCKENQFACPIERTCLSNEKVCDGKYDCDIRHVTNTTFNFNIPITKSDENREMCSRKG